MYRYVDRHKQGYTDGEAVLDLVVVDEAHVDWAQPENIKGQKTWIVANGRRLVDLYHFGVLRFGFGVLYVEWDDGNAHERLASAIFHAYEEYERRLETRFDVAEWQRWLERNRIHDPEATLVLSFGDPIPEAEFGFSYYLVGMRDGGRLPTRVERPPFDR